MEYRIEKDTMGEMQVPADRYWAAQTQRSRENFPIGDEIMPREITHAFGILKKAAALANCKLGKLSEEKKNAICAACDEVISGELNGHFPLVVWQTGSGTQSNMNAYEVIANRGNELAGKKLLHPNDDINMSQSSNDTFPTALHISAVTIIKDKLIPAVNVLIETFKKLEQAVVSIPLVQNKSLTPKGIPSKALFVPFKYLFSDFKKNNGYKRSCKISREYGLYRQDYCGCIFSKR